MGQSLARAVNCSLILKRAMSWSGYFIAAVFCRSQEDNMHRPNATLLAHIAQRDLSCYTIVDTKLDKNIVDIEKCFFLWLKSSLAVRKTQLAREIPSTYLGVYWTNNMFLQ